MYIVRHVWTIGPDGKKRYSPLKTVKETLLVNAVVFGALWVVIAIVVAIGWVK